MQVVLPELDGRIGSFWSATIRCRLARAHRNARSPPMRPIDGIARAVKLATNWTTLRATPASRAPRCGGPRQLPHPRRPPAPLGWAMMRRSRRWRFCGRWRAQSTSPVEPQRTPPLEGRGSGGGVQYHRWCPRSSPPPPPLPSRGGEPREPATATSLLPCSKPAPPTPIRSAAPAYGSPCIATASCSRRCPPRSRPRSPPAGATPQPTPSCAARPNPFHLPALRPRQRHRPAAARARLPSRRDCQLSRSGPRAAARLPRRLSPAAPRVRRPCRHPQRQARQSRVAARQGHRARRPVILPRSGPSCRSSIRSSSTIPARAPRPSAAPAR